MTGPTGQLRVLVAAGMPEPDARVCLAAGWWAEQTLVVFTRARGFTPAVTRLARAGVSPEAALVLVEHPGAVDALPHAGVAGVLTLAGLGVDLTEAAQVLARGVRVDQVVAVHTAVAAAGSVLAMWQLHVGLRAGLTVEQVQACLVAGADMIAVCHCLALGHPVDQVLGWHVQGVDLRLVAAGVIPAGWVPPSGGAV